MNGGPEKVLSNNPDPALLKLYYCNDTNLKLGGGGLLILYLFAMARTLPGCRGANALAVCTDEGILWNAEKPGAQAGISISLLRWMGHCRISIFCPGLCLLLFGDLLRKLTGKFWP